MGFWTSTNTDERYVELWVPVLLEKGWPAVRAAIVRGSSASPSEWTLEQVAVGVAGAIIVGAASGHPDAEMPAKVQGWIKANSSKLEPALVPLALGAVKRALEFYADIWGEGDETFGYQTAAMELCRALGEVEGDERDAPES